MASPPFPSLTSVFMTVEDSKVRFGNEAVLYAIACEIESIGTDTVHKSQQVSSGDDDDSNGSSSSDRSDGRKGFDFRLEGFLTRPRVCNKLFPPHIQRERYSMISVQERLIMLSVEPSLTVGQEQSDSDKARKDESSSSVKGALLVAALEALEYTLFPLDTNSDQNIKSADPSQSSPSCPIERILYISKVDSSGCWPSCGINTHGLKSPARVLVSGYLKAMQLQRSEPNPSSSISVKVNSSTSETVAASAAEPTSETAAQMSSLKISPLPNKETEPNSTPSTNTTETTTTPPGTDDLIERYHVKKTSIYVFARAQPQYLFRDSAKNLGKHVLSDRDLVRWWKNMIASTYGTKPNGIDNGNTATDSQPLSEEKPQEINIPTDICGWWLIPGIGSEREALRVIQSSHSTSSLAWTYGHPHKGSREMAQSLIPQFPDDPKSRMMQSAMSNHGKVDIDTFWELAAIGEESGSGKITGYFRVDEQVSDEQKTEDTKKLETEKSLEGTENPSEETEETKQKKKVKKNARMDTLQLGAKVADEFKKVVSDLSIHALSDKRGTTSDFTKVINKLLDLDFSDPNVAIESTRRWRGYVDKWLDRADEDSARQKFVIQRRLAVRTSKVLPEVPEVSSWIQQGVVSVWLPPAEEMKNANVVVTENGATTQTAQHSGTDPTIASQQQPAAVNVLGAGLIKRKVPDATATTQQPAAVNILGAGLIKRKVPDATATTQPPVAVNILGAGLIKRKAPASTPVADQPSSQSSIASTSSGSTAAGTPESSTSAPVVNVLGASFIKKRKIDP